MKNHLTLLIFSLLFILSFGVFQQVSACSCVPSAPCQYFDRADVVFVGKVVGSKFQRTEEEYDYNENANTSVQTQPKKITYDIGEIYFEVDEAFRGTEKGAKVTIFSSTGGGDCGYWFKRGETYVVFASKEGSPSDSGVSSLTYGGSVQKLKPNAERLWTTICAGTREIKAADEALNYLRNLPKAGAGGMILGRIDESIKDYSNENLTGKPMVDAKIKIQQIDGEKKVYYGTSNQNGYFEVKVPIGRYLVLPELSDFLTFSTSYEDEDENKILEIKDQKCGTKIFWVTNNSEIKGKVVDANGKIFTDGSIDLIPFGKNRGDDGFDYKFAIIEDDGTFSFKGVPLGKYQISLNYTDNPDDDSPYPTYFYPNTNNRSQAKVFEIGYGTKFNEIVFQMPPKLVKRKIYGEVVWKNGKAAANAEVQLKDVEFNQSLVFNKTETNMRGQFVLEWFEGRKYQIEVIVWQKSADGQSSFGIASAESEIFTLDDKTQKFRIVLDQNNPNEKTINRRTVRSN